MNTCRTCIHYKPENENYGSCVSSKFVRGYGAGTIGEGISTDSVRVEDDEGWAFTVGKDFGCIHHVETEHP